MGAKELKLTVALSSLHASRARGLVTLSLEQGTGETLSRLTVSLDRNQQHLLMLYLKECLAAPTRT